MVSWIWYVCAEAFPVPPRVLVSYTPKHRYTGLRTYSTLRTDTEECPGVHNRSSRRSRSTGRYSFRREAKLTRRETDINRGVRPVCISLDAMAPAGGLCGGFQSQPSWYSSNCSGGVRRTLSSLSTLETLNVGLGQSWSSRDIASASYCQRGEIRTHRLSRVGLRYGSG